MLGFVLATGVFSLTSELHKDYLSVFASSQEMSDLSGNQSIFHVVDDAGEGF